MKEDEEYETAGRFFIAAALIDRRCKFVYPGTCAGC